MELVGNSHWMIPPLDDKKCVHRSHVKNHQVEVQWESCQVSKKQGKFNVEKYPPKKISYREFKWSSWGKKIAQKHKKPGL